MDTGRSNEPFTSCPLLYYHSCHLFLFSHLSCQFLQSTEDKFREHMAAKVTGLLFWSRHTACAPLGHDSCSDLPKWSLWRNCMCVRAHTHNTFQCSLCLCTVPSKDRSLQWDTTVSLSLYVHSWYSPLLIGCWELSHRAGSESVCHLGVTPLAVMSHFLPRARGDASMLVVFIFQVVAVMLF